MDFASETEEAIKRIYNAVKKQNGNEDEILKLIFHLPCITTTYLPYDFSASSHSTLTKSYDEDEVPVNSLFMFLAKWLTDRLKDIFLLSSRDDAYNEPVNKLCGLSEGQIAKACEFYESLEILGGCQYAGERFSTVLHNVMNYLLQHHMKYTTNALTDIADLEKNFTSLFADVKVLTLDVNKILFFCGKLNIVQQANYISEAILEKLSIELLSLVDALKEDLIKTGASNSSVTSSSHSNIFSASDTKELSGDLYFKLYELATISRIIGLYLDLEDELHSSKFTNLLKMKCQVEGSKKSSMKQKNQLPDLLRSSHQSTLVRSSQIYGIWNWQELLKDIAPIIAVSIKKAFEECEANAIGEARNAYHAGDCCQLIVVESASSIEHKRHAVVPKKAISCYVQALKLTEMLLPLAVLGNQYKPVAVLFSQYVDQCGLILKSLKSYLMTVTSDMPSKGDVDNLYYVLSTCEDVCNVVAYCGSKMHVEPRVPFQGVLNIYKELNRTIKNMIVHHQTVRLSSYVLHDPASHHWSDPREFNEGESCSVSIQAWNLFLARLWFDLGLSVSEIQRHEIFSEVLSNSLHILEQRYSHCTPSYNRTKQVKIDVTAILLICRSFLFHMDFHPTKIFPKDVNRSCIFATHNITRMHTSCENLLTSMCFLSSPLNALLGSSENMTAELTSSWLSWINSSIFPYTWDSSFSSLPDEQSVYCVVKCIEMHPSQELLHCLFALVMRHCFFLKKIMSGKIKLDPDRVEDDLLDSDIFTLFSSCSNQFESMFYKCAVKAVGGDKQKLYDGCNCQLVNHFEYKWQNSFHAEIIATMCKSMQKVGRYVNNITWSTISSDLLSTLPNAVRDQLIDISESMNTESTGNYLLVCALLALKGIVHCLCNLPQWLITFFSHLDHEGKVKSDLMFHRAGLDLLVYAACHVFECYNLWDEHHGIEFRKQGVDLLKKCSTVLLDICKENKFPPGLKQIKDLVQQDLAELTETYSLTITDNVREKREFLISDVQLLDMCRTQLMSMNDDAIESLKRIKNLIVCNRDTITSNWGLNQYLGSEAKLGNKNLNLSQNSPTEVSDTFNPIAAFCRIGKLDFGQGRIVDFPWDWQRLCSSLLLTQDIETMKYLLSHRWEFKDGALLQDDEHDLVKEIKLRFNMNSS